MVKQLDIELTDSTGKVYWVCECDCGCGTIKSIQSNILAQTIIGGCDNVQTPKKIQCRRCGKIFSPKKKGGNRKYCYDCIPEGQQTRIRQKIKQWGLEYKGNKCSLCGYDKCKDALEFHHIDPLEKDFNISDRNLKLDWTAIKTELDKCILVCANCHREIHSNLENDEIIVKDLTESFSNSKPVRCLNTNKVFGSAALAGKYYNINFPLHIKDVCNGKRKTCGNMDGEPLQWEWVNPTEEDLANIILNIEDREKRKQEQIDKIKITRSIKVRCSTGEEFDSLAEAAKWCNLKNQACIKRALTNPNYTSGVHPDTGERLHWTQIIDKG